MVSYTTVRVHGRSKRFDQNTSVGWGRVNPPGEARMLVPLRKGKDHVFDEGERLLEWLSFLWKFLLSNNPAYIVRHWLPYRTLTYSTQVRGDFVHDLVAELPEGLLIKG